MKSDLTMLKRALPLACAALAIAGSAQAALQDRDLDGDTVVDAFYDTDLDITWLRDANVNGFMNWATAESWASAYNIGGHGGWRLPTSHILCPGFDCTGSEMGHLWYVDLGNTAGGPLTNTGSFQNMSPQYYRSGTAFSGDFAYVFSMADGSQGLALTTDAKLAMAVHDGDVAALPEPETYALMLAGLAGLALVSSRSRRR